MQVYRQNFFTKCLLNPIIEPFRIVVFSIITAMIFIMLISLSQHPVSNNFILSDEEVDSIFSNCSVKDDSARNLNLVIFIPFNENQIDLVIARIEKWKEANYCPCAISKFKQAKPYTDLIFFFIGDLEKHFWIQSKILRTIVMKSKRIRNIRPCFDEIHFKSLRDMDLPSRIKIPDLFYGLFNSNLLAKYTHMVWMDITVSTMRKNWLEALYNVIREEEPFWVLGSMTLSSLPNHFDPGYYHININALYRVNNKCFNQFLKRVRNEYEYTTPDLAIHLYRTSFVHFREAQYIHHLFRYSRLFISLDIRMFVSTNIKASNWPETYFISQDRHWARFGQPVNRIQIQQENETKENMENYEEINNEIKEEKVESR